MAVPVFSLDIREDIISGVVLETRGGRSVITGCAAVPRGRRELGETVGEVMKQARFQGGPCRVCLPAGHFFFRNLSLPFADPGKINKVLPFELEATAPVEIEKLVVDAIITGSENGKGEAIAAMVERELLAQRLSLLQDVGLDPEIIDVSGVQTAIRLVDLPGFPADLLFLDLGRQRAVMVVTSGRRIVLVRSLEVDEDGSMAGIRLGDDSAEATQQTPEQSAEICASFASAVQQTLLAAGMRENAIPVYLSGPGCELAGLATALHDTLGAEVRRCDLLRQQSFVKAAPGIEAGWIPRIMDQALALAMQTGRSRKGFNFRRGEFAAKTSFARFRSLYSRIGVSFIALSVIIFILLSWQAISGRMEERRLTAQIRTIFSETLPEMTKIVEPVGQLQAEIKRLGAGGQRSGNELKVLDLLAELSERIPASSRVRLTQMALDDRGVRIKGSAGTFNAVDTVKKNLEKSSYFQSVTITSANLAQKGDEVLFEIKLQLSGS
jgi:general secretion pathway protein L